MAAAVVPQQLAAQLKYGPQTASSLRRSQYLADALKQMQEQGGQNIQSPAELGAKLLATAILYRSGRKADADALSALKSQQDAETESTLAGLRLPAIAPQPPQTPQQPASQDPVTAPTVATAPPPVPVEQAPLPAPSRYSPQDRDALTRMLAVEALGEGPQGMAAAGHVALNRLNSGYGGAKSLSEIIYQPHQFEGISRANQISPEDYAQAQQVADALLDGKIPDPTNGAMAFLNPDLQLRLGRSIPKWAQGDGQRIGNHVFFGGKPQAEVQLASAPAQPQGPQVAPTMAEAQAAEPYQVASNGPMPPPPSAPGSSPSAAGTPPAAPPQAPAAGGTFGPQGLGVTSEQLSFLEKLLRNPQTHDVGMQYAMELQKKAAEPVQWQTTTVNGLPAAFNPVTQEVRILPLPESARTRTLAGADGMPAGSVVQEKPTGERSVLYQPPTGYQGAPNQQSYIRGGPNDPASGANLVQNEGKLRDDYAKEITPYVQAREGYQKVVQAAKGGTPADDIALVFGYMKTLDPGSTVREGEQATVQNSGTIPQTIQNMYNKLITGQGRLTPEQRAQFAQSAANQFEVYQRTFDAANQRYGELAKSYGFDPGRVVRHFDPIEPYRVPQPNAANQQNGVPLADVAWRKLNAQGQINLQRQKGDRARPFVARTPEEIRALDVPANKGKYVIGPDGSMGVIE